MFPKNMLRFYRISQGNDDLKVLKSEYCTKFHSHNIQVVLVFDNPRFKKFGYTHHSICFFLIVVDASEEDTIPKITLRDIQHGIAIDEIRCPPSSKAIYAIDEPITVECPNCRT
jgi:dephospho-CoA kinase